MSGRFPDEIAGGQFLDLHAVEGFGIELPVEPFQGLAVRKASFPDPPKRTFALVDSGGNSTTASFQTVYVLGLQVGNGEIRMADLVRSEPNDGSGGSSLVALIDDGKPIANSQALPKSALGWIRSTNGAIRRNPSSPGWNKPYEKNGRFVFSGIIIG
jgi:hypothetical protein